MMTAAEVLGRENEIQALIDAYKKATSPTAPAQQFVLIQGVSGSGKTVLANTLLPHVERDGGFFLTGKFELSRFQTPYAVFIQAFNLFVDVLSGDDSRQPDERLPKFREAILQAAREEAKILTDMIPALTRIIGEQSDVCKVSAADAVQRLHFVFAKFCSAVASIAPVVILLDDLQWSDKASLDLLSVLLQPGSHSALIVIGTFRNEEVGPMRPQSQPKSTFERYLDETQLLHNSSRHLTVSLIDLKSMDDSSVNQLVAATLGIPSSMATLKLAEYLRRSCKGNIFHVLVKLQALGNRRIVCHEDKTNDIVFNENELDNLSFSEDNSVDEIFRHSIVSMSDFSQQVLTIAACLGDEIDEVAMSTLLDGRIEDVSASLEAAMKMEILTFMPSVGRYRFRHDRTRQATLSLVEDVNAVSFDLGRKLWQRSSPHALYSKMFVIANMLLNGVSKVSDKDERLQMAGYFREAGTKAASLSAIADASRYFEAGITLLGDDNIWSENYDLALGLFNGADDAALCNQKFDRVAVLARQIIARARTYNDKITAYTAMVNAAGQNGNAKMAVQVGLQVLDQLGVHLSIKPSLFTVIKEIMKTKRAIGRRSDFDILTLPGMEDESKLAAMHLLRNLLPYSFWLDSGLIVLVATTLVQLTMKFGLSKLSSLGFAHFAWVLCKSERKEGYRIGQLAMAMVQNQRAKELAPILSGGIYCFVNPWTQPMRESLDPLWKAYSLAMENGDVENAMYNLSFRAALLLNSGSPLVTVEDALTELIGQLTLYKQTNLKGVMLPYIQFIHNLTSRAPDPMILSGTMFNVNKDVSSANKFQQVICWGMGAELAFRFGDCNLAQQLVDNRRALPENFAVQSYAVDYFNDGIVAAALFRVAKRRLRHRQRKQLLQSTRMMKSWAKDCPHNFCHKLRLLEAECKSLSCQKSVDSNIVSLYQEAIDRAYSEGFRQDAALASELAGDYHSRCGQSETAMEYWNRSLELYLEWGATSKAAQLSERIASG